MRVVLTYPRRASKRYVPNLNIMLVTVLSICADEGAYQSGVRHRILLLVHC